jgi:hypothetical protein
MAMISDRIAAAFCAFPRAASASAMRKRRNGATSG